MRGSLLLLLLGVCSCSDFDALTAQFGGRDLSSGSEDLAMPFGDVDLAGGADFASEDLVGADLTTNCSDGQLGFGESDVDCGGPCTPCDLGRKCNVAGDCTTGTCEVGRCELTSGPPSWVIVTTSGTAPNTRNDVALERSADGNLVLAGGISGSGNFFYDDSDKLDVTTLAWSALNNLANNRGGPVATASATTVYVLYGADGSSTFRADYERHATGTTWSTSAQPTYSISHAGGVFANNKIYVVGGRDAAGVIKTVRSFDPAGTTFDSNPPALAVARARAGVTLGPDGRIYAIGGWDGTSSLASGEAAMPGGAWAAIAAMPQPRVATDAVLAPDGRIYVTGGADLATGTVWKTVIAYTAGAAPTGDRWTNVASLSESRYRHGAAVGGDGRIYVIGGSALFGTTGVVEAYGPRITAAPNNAAAGGTTSVTGSNFAKQATVSFSLGSATGAVIGTGTTDVNGDLPATTVTIPGDTGAGATRLFARDNRSRYPVSVAFTVN
jgi:hypothetical protein